MILVAKTNVRCLGQMYRAGDELPEDHKLTEAEIKSLVEHGAVEVKKAPAPVQETPPTKPAAPATKPTGPAAKKD